MLISYPVDTYGKRSCARTTHKHHISPILRFLPGRSLYTAYLRIGKESTMPYSRPCLQVLEAGGSWNSKDVTENQNNRGANLDMLEAWLVRSSQTPLTIHLDDFSSKSRKVFAKLSVGGGKILFVIYLTSGCGWNFAKLYSRARGV